MWLQGACGSSACPCHPLPAPCHRHHLPWDAGWSLLHSLTLFPTGQSHRSALAHKEPSVWAVRWLASLLPAQGHSTHQGPPSPSPVGPVDTLLEHQHPLLGRGSSG